MSCNSARLFIACALLATAACSDGTAPEPPFTVEVQGAVSNRRFYPDSAGAPLMECDVSLTASATGDQDRNAEWGSGMVRLYAGPGRVAPLDSIRLSALEVRAAWRSGVIAPGRPPQQADWRFVAGVPFSAEFEFTYRIDDDSRTTAPVRADCGPAGRAGYAAPTVSVLESPGETAEFGHFIRVVISGEAPAGAWEVGLIAGGAFEGRAWKEGKLRTVFRDTVALRVPPNGLLNGQVQLTVYVTDGLLRETRAAVPVQPILIDRSPPLVSTLGFDVPRTGYPAVTYGGWFAPGSTIPVLFGGNDNRGLGWLVYRTESTADSLPMAPRETSVRLEVPVDPRWPSAPELELYVRDMTGLRSAWSLRTQPGAVRIVPRLQANVSQLPNPERAPIHAVADPARARLYLAMGSTLRSYALPGLDLLGETPLPAALRSIDISEDGERLYMVDALGALLTVGVAAGSPVQAIAVDLPPGAVILSAVALAGSSLGLAVYQNGEYRVYLAPRAGGQAAARTGALAGMDPKIIRSPDRTSLLVRSPSCTMRLTIPEGTTPCAVVPTSGLASLSLGGQRIGLGDAVYTGDFTLLRNFEYPRYFGSDVTALAADGRSLWMSSTQGFVRLDVESGLPVHTIVHPRGETLHLGSGADGHLHGHTASGWFVSASFTALAADRR